MRGRVVQKRHWRGSIGLAHACVVGGAYWIGLLTVSDWLKFSMIDCNFKSFGLFSHREGDLRVIRPFVYTRERDLRDFAEKVKKIPLDSFRYKTVSFIL